MTTDPELFGHPVTGRRDLWPPKAVPTASALADLEASSRRKISYDWKFFAIAAVVVAICVGLAFAAMSFGG
jgi:hypothetical protein